MIRCPECNSEIEEGSNECPICGFPVNEKLVDNPINEINIDETEVDYNDSSNLQKEMIDGEEGIMEALPREICDSTMVKNNSRNKGLRTIAIVLLSLCTVCLCYLSISEIQKNTSNEILIIRISELESLSDYQQVQQALKWGGMISVHDDFREIDSSVYEHFGALNYDGRYYVMGAFFNYVESKGWRLIDSYLNTIFYFEK